MIVSRNPMEMYQSILETLKKSSSMIIEDDHKAFASALYNKRAQGKLLLVD